MKLVACPNCHAQYDVSEHGGSLVPCRCGTSFPAEAPAAKDAAVTRCSACGALVAEKERTCSYCEAEIVRRAEPTGPVCPECYARNPLRARHCTACGIAFQPQPTRRDTVALECPVCSGVRLQPRHLGGLWVEECPMCQGLWAPGDVMDRLVERIRERRRREGPPPAGHATRERRAAWQERITYRNCPECRGRMQRRNFGRRSGVIVDWCGSHGTWLDANEMEDVAAFVLGGGLEQTTTDAAGNRWSLPADPARTAAVLAAEQLLAEARARSQARDHTSPFGPRTTWRGIGDFLSELLKA